MNSLAPKRPAPSTPSGPRSIGDVAAITADAALQAMSSAPDGLTDAEAAARLARYGPNAIGVHHAHPLAILGRQFRNAVLILLLGTSIAAFLLGDQNDAIIVAVILAASVGLGFVNEYRAERQSAALRDALPHRAVVVRGGQQHTVDVTTVVPGDIVRVSLGSMIPADIRLIEVAGLECNESVLTGETAARVKKVEPVASGLSIGDLDSCALMGSVVSGGSGLGVVTATGAESEFGAIASGLDTKAPETAFQVGLRKFSVLLLWVAVILSASIVVTGFLLHRSIIETLLFALAIAVGVTPQLLPAVVSSSLSAGSRQLARRHILIKRLVSIEDLGNIGVLVTDKTGTITVGTIELIQALDPAGVEDPGVLRLGRMAVDTGGGTGDAAVGANEIDDALLRATKAAPIPSSQAYTVLGTVPFDHERMLSSVLVDTGTSERTIIVKGAPEELLRRCVGVPAAAEAVMQREFAAGRRLIALGTKTSDDGPLTAASEDGLTLAGFLSFSDPPRPDAATELARLRDLGIAVVVATGDNATVAQHLAAEVGLPEAIILTGVQIDAMKDDALATALSQGGIAARISPEQKRRIVHVLRHGDRTIGFLGDGINDALALHAADVGISVVSATDVARDAADVVLLDKSLGSVVAGVEAGRHIFGNTIKYVLMGTSSNFGNMMSAAAASTFLSFLPMLPGQVLLNNLLYDASQLAISTDAVDVEQTRRPSHWDMRLIRRFMLVFGPASSLFDFVTFALLLGVVHAGPEVFRTGWFVESITTQAIVVFIIRTRRVPFFRSRPSWQLIAAVAAVVVIGWTLPFTPIGAFFGLVPLEPALLAGIAVLTVVYVVLIDAVKWFFYRRGSRPEPLSDNHRHVARVRRTASRYASTGG